MTRCDARRTSDQANGIRRRRRDARVVSAYIEGRSVVEVARIFELSRRTINVILNKSNVQYRSKARSEVAELVEVELWNTEPQAVEAVRRTMQALKPGGDLIEKDGRFFVPSGFPAWAAERQGYVKRLVPTEDK